MQQLPIERLIYSTVRIECSLADDRSSAGTGFFFLLRQGESAFPVIITNKHVIHDAIKGRIHLTLKDDQGSPKLGSHIPLDLDNFEKRWIAHPDPNIDLAAFPFGPLVNTEKEKGNEFFLIPLGNELIPSNQLLQELSVMEEIVMIGYPLSIWDNVHNLPIVRRGVTATLPRLDYNGRAEFLIDAACFPGSSGSPVFLANLGSYMDKYGRTIIGYRIALLGILYGGAQLTVKGEVKIVDIPTDTKPISLSRIPINLGNVIKSCKLLDFEPIIKTFIEG